MTIYPVRRTMGPTLWFVGAIVAGLFVTLALYWLVLLPPAIDMRMFTITLIVCGVIVLVAGITLMRMGIVRRLPRLEAKLWVGYLLVAVLVCLCIFIVARTLFISEYDLALTVVLLLFVATIIMGVGYLQSAIISEKLDALSGAAEALALGRYHTRVEIEGGDQLARLGAVFNAMAEQMEAVNRKEYQLDQLRRDLVVWTGYDLRIPLTSVRTMVQALADGVAADPETYRRFLRTANRDANALSDLIDDLADMAQINVNGIAIDRHPTDVGRLLEETASALAAMATEKNVTLAATVAPGLMPLSVDARQIGRALYNLVSHALNRTPAGGSVKMHAYPARNGVLVDIVDSYEGARPEDVQRVFELFFGDEESSTQSNNSRLSLAMAQAIVQAHGSRIRAQKLSGQGMRLVFTLSQSGTSNPLQGGM
jgi:signal transduction histidine kinase